MPKVFRAEYVSLHVRRSNTAAIHLYHDTLGFDVHLVDEGYYADKEDALDMRKYFGEEKKEMLALKGAKLKQKK